MVRQLHDDSLYRKLVGINRDLQKVGGFLSVTSSMSFHFNIWRTLRFTRPER
jgi:hypothetical protein